MSAYYITGDKLPDIVDMFAFSLPAAAILVFTYMMLVIDERSKKVTITLAAAVNAIMLVWFAAMWIMGEGIGFSYGFFVLILSFCYLAVFGISVGHDERNVLRDISYGSFGALIIIIIVVIFILSEGEMLEGVADIGGGDVNEKKKKGIKK